MSNRKALYMLLIAQYAPKCTLDKPGNMYLTEWRKPDLKNPTKVYSSDCYYTRVTVESALIHEAPTIQSNTATSSNNSNILVAPVICKATKLNWQNLANCIPQMDQKAIPPHKRSLFGSHIPIIRPSPETSSQPLGTPVAARTRHGVIGRAFHHISLDI